MPYVFIALHYRCLDTRTMHIQCVPLRSFTPPLNSSLCRFKLFTSLHKCERSQSFQQSQT